MIRQATLLPETMTQCRRIIADGGTIIDQKYMDRVIRTLKAQGIYTSCKFLADANFAVKKDGSNAVSTLYDISGNNNDAVQATGAAQPIWTAAQQNGKAGLVFDGSSSNLTSAAFASALSRPNTLIAVAKFTPVGTTARIFMDGILVTNRQQLYYSGSVTRETLYAGSSATSSASGSAGSETRLLVGTFNGVSSNLWSRGSQIITNGNAGTHTMTGVTLGGDYNATAVNILNGWLAIGIVLNTALTTAQRQSLEGLLNSYYAIY